MTVRVVAGEESVFAPGRAEQGAAYAAEGEGAGRVGVWRWRGFESALELRDALAEGVVGKVQEPADFLAGVTAESEESGDAQGGGEVGDGDSPLRLAASWRSTSLVLRTREESSFPVAFAVAAAISLFGFQSGAALATVVGVLIEVPVMLLVVRAVNGSRVWYDAGRRKSVAGGR